MIGIECLGIASAMLRPGRRRRGDREASGGRVLRRAESARPRDAVSRAACASPGTGRSRAAASTATGSGASASCRARRSRGWSRCWCRARTTAWSTPGTWRACAARAATTSRSTTCSCPSVHHARLLQRTRESGPLFRFPPFSRLAYNKVGVATGIARGAIDDFVALATQKMPRASPKPLRERHLRAGGDRGRRDAAALGARVRVRGRRRGLADRARRRRGDHEAARARAARLLAGGRGLRARGRDRVRRRGHHVELPRRARSSGACATCTSWASTSWCRRR